MHCKISYPVQRDFQYFSTLLLFHIHFSWAVCLIPDLLPQADTGLCLQVGSQDMRWVYLLYSAFLVVVGIWCAFLGGKWQYCYFTWARHMAEHSTTEECWWVNSESLRAKQSIVKRKKSTIPNRLKISIWRFQALLEFLFAATPLLCSVYWMHSLLWHLVRHTYVCMLTQISQEIWSLGVAPMRSCSLCF